MSGSATDESSAATTRVGLVVRVVVWGSLYVGTALIGRLSGDAAGVLTLVAPSAGIAVVWFTSGDRRTWGWDLTALALATALVVQLAFPDQRLIFLAVPNTLLQVVVFGYVLARLTPFYWAERRSRPLSGGSDLGAILVASIAAGLVGAAIGSLNYWLVVDAPVLPDGLIRLGRNAVAIFVVAGVAGTLPAGLRTWRGIRQGMRGPHGVSTRRLAEVGWLIATTLALFIFGFGDSQGRPVGFLLLLPAIWVGMRFSSFAGGLFSLACSVVVVWLTLAGVGSFTTITDPYERAIIAQLLVATLVAVTLLLSLTRVALTRALDALTERNEIVDAALGAMDEGFTIIDSSGRVLERNDAISSLLGRQDLTSRAAQATSYEMFHPDGRRLVEGELPYERALEGEEVETQEVHLRLGDESTRILEMTSRLLRHSPDAERRAFVLMRDVTANRKQTEALNAFAGVVAHDLNGPLAAVTGWAGALLDRLEEGQDLPPEEGLPMVRRVVDASERMRVLIADLLGYATARNKVPRPETVDIGDVVRQTLSLRDAPDGIGPADVELHTPDKVWADPLLTRQLVENLVGNAIKYVAPAVRPHVVVGTRALPDGYVEVCLADNGLGIPADERPLVFETFHRVHREGYSGTGLGLAICKQIVESHGGTIEARENPLGGTVMRFTLPMSAEALGARRTDRVS